MPPGPRRLLPVVWALAVCAASPASAVLSLSWGNVSFPSIQTPRTNHAAVELDDRTYVLGGKDAAGNPLATLEVWSGTAWLWRASLSVSRTGLAAAALDGKVYAFGGDDGVTPLNTLEAYDPRTDAWSPKASLSVARRYAAAAVLDGKLYAIAGRSLIGGGDLASVERYDPATDTWTARASLSSARNDLAAAAYRGRVFALGGAVPGQVLATAEAYDPAANVWTRVADMPTAREGLAAVVFGGRLVAFGGANASGNLAACEMYDAAADRWMALTDMLEARTGLRAVVHEQQILAIGGYGGSTLALVRVGSPCGSYFAGSPYYVLNWGYRSPMPTARSRLGAAPLDGLLYAVGGLTAGSAATGATERYDPRTDAWSARAALSVPRYALGVAALDGRVYAAGGVNAAGAVSGAMEAYDPATNGWSSKAVLPTARHGLGFAAVGPLLYAVGGAGGSGVLGTVEAYDPVADAWTAKAPMSTARTGLAVAVHGGLIYAIGGTGTSYFRVERYDPATDTWTTLVLNGGSAYDGLAAAAAGGWVHFGGNGSGGTAPLFFINPAAPTSFGTNNNGMRTWRRDLAMAELDGALYAIGGVGSDGATLAGMDRATTCAGADLSASFSSSGSTSVAGGTLTAVLGVRNGGSTATALAPLQPRVTGSAVLVPQSGPVPTAVGSLSYPDSASFTWTYAVAEIGTARISTTLQAVDGPSGDAIALTAAADAATLLDEPVFNRTVGHGKLIIAPNAVTLGDAGAAAVVYMQGDAGGMVVVDVYDEAGRRIGAVNLTLDGNGRGVARLTPAMLKSSGAGAGVFWAAAKGGGVADRKPFMVRDR